MKHTKKWDGVEVSKERREEMIRSVYVGLKRPSARSEDYAFSRTGDTLVVGFRGKDGAVEVFDCAVRSITASWNEDDEHNKEVANG